MKEAGKLTIIQDINNHFKDGNTVYRVEIDGRTANAIMKHGPVKYIHLDINHALATKSHRYWTTAQAVERCARIGSWALGMPFQKAGTLPIGKVAPVACSPSQAAAWAVLRGQGGGLLTGGPGTGKTWLLQQIVKSLPEGTFVRGCAPTGKAASRLEQGMDIPCSTIHRLIGLPDNEHEVEADVLVIDESSMIDEDVFDILIRNINFRKTHVIFAGDRNQLSPVDPGQPFYDLCVNMKDCVANLDENHRFSPGIGQLSQNIMVSDKMHGTYENVFFMHPSHRGQRKAKAAKELQLNDKLHKHFGLTDWRKETIVLCYTNAECAELNAQHHEDPYPRMMFIKNDYDYSVYNGQMCSMDGYKVTHDDGRVLDIPRRHFNQITQRAFGITIHKSQGSEWPVVILMMPDDAFEIGRDLIYTAMTRAKKGLIVLGRHDAKLVDTKRQTLLDLYLSHDGNMELPDVI